VYLYFNNDWEGHAVRDAAALEDLLGVDCSKHASSSRS